ncbi:uncharacterized protein LOC127862074 [Dreissena polymorpha]|uniref:Copper transport protein n=1 Tax=Dreissena polymorpha TaxID=45954 RepID=A0A9D3Y8V1_DREPO|nr:uncharacterized protein LOC127862074 [Dreissena polymorpha]XP_052256982.1 uncharacterized protein LOC127862074 [Dreissena polymorpha]XP_052256984.1 uncharacterized protein LOC127862074 [Dreissena polymorpha]XP_052256985.1 uncharacterized protein LOC127862074 [Dreissena polymorpha]KAH3695720.1 hypothetical protein DPMN_083178 [Dreissena polymorpha]
MAADRSSDWNQHSDHQPFLALKTATTLVAAVWSTDSVYGLTGAMLAAVFASVTYECLSEYLLHLRRAARAKKNNSTCCGQPVVSCGEKLGQTVIHVMRVLFAYFLMLCVMTMNVWLMISVFVGAAVGHGVGKPIVANGTHDAISSHGYDSVGVSFNAARRNSKRTERSLSWRYQPINMINPDHLIRPGKRGSDSVFGDVDDRQIVRNSKLIVKPNNGDGGVNLVWLRKSSENLQSLSSEHSNMHDTKQVRHHHDSSQSCPNDILDESSKSLTDSASSSVRRFKPTSKVINDSFRSSRSTSGISRQNSSSSSLHIQVIQGSPNVSTFRSHKHSSDVNVLRAQSNSPEVTLRSGSSVNRSVSSTSGRFKPASQNIRKLTSFNGSDRV